MTFALIFLLTMSWAPVLGVLSQTQRMPGLSPETREAARRALVRCVSIAGALTAGVLATWALAPDVLLLRPVPIVGGIGAFHVGWWFGAHPLMRRTAEEVRARAPRPEPTRRVASLVPRDESALLPPALWAIPIALVVAATLAIGAAALVGEFPTRGRHAFAVSATWLGAVGFLVGWGFWARATARAPQDLARALDAPEVDRLCRDFRRFIVRALFVGTTLAVALFAGVAITLAWWGPDGEVGRTLGIAGGVGGGLMGVWGSVFGVLADRRRRAIIELGGVPPA